MRSRSEDHHQHQSRNQAKCGKCQPEDPQQADVPRQPALDGHQRDNRYALATRGTKALLIPQLSSTGIAIHALRFLSFRIRMNTIVCSGYFTAEPAMRSRRKSQYTSGIRLFAGDGEGGTL